MTHARSIRVAPLVFVAALSPRALAGTQAPAQPAPDYNAYYQIGPDSHALERSFNAAKNK